MELTWNNKLTCIVASCWWFHYFSAANSSLASPAQKKTENPVISTYRYNWRYTNQWIWRHPSTAGYMNVKKLVSRRLRCTHRVNPYTKLLSEKRTSVNGWQIVLIYHPKSDAILKFLPAQQAQGRFNSTDVPLDVRTFLDGCRAVYKVATGPCISCWPGESLQCFLSLWFWWMISGNILIT